MSYLKIFLFIVGKIVVEGRILKVSIVLLVLLSAAVNCRQEPRFAEVRAQNGLILRMEPKISSPSKATIPFGQTLIVLGDGPTETLEGVSARWYQVEYGETTGWVYGGFLLFHEDCSCDFTRNFRSSIYHNQCSLPLSLEHVSGGSMDDSFSLFEYKSNDAYYFWLNQGSQKHDQPCWHVSDSLQISKTDIPQGFEIVTFQCIYDGKPDPEVIAILLFDSQGKSNIIKSWRANRKSKKFESIDQEKVDCKPLCMGGSCI